MNSGNKEKNESGGVHLWGNKKPGKVAPDRHEWVSMLSKKTSWGLKSFGEIRSLDYRTQQLRSGASSRSTRRFTEPRNPAEISLGECRTLARVGEKKNSGDERRACRENLDRANPSGA
jgi:hypothetical protein